MLIKHSIVENYYLENLLVDKSRYLVSKKYIFNVFE